MEIARTAIPLGTPVVAVLYDGELLIKLLKAAFLWQVLCSDLFHPRVGLRVVFFLATHRDEDSDKRYEADTDNDEAPD